MSRDDVTVLADVPGEGFAVIHAGRETIGAQDPYFTVTMDLYPSRASYEAGNVNAQIGGGAAHETILKVAPNLQRVVDLHLASAITGEPMHGVSNGWYHIGGADMAHEIKYREQGRKNYYNAPDDINSPEFKQFFIDMGCRSLRCTPDELPNLECDLCGLERKEVFEEWANVVLRPRWQREADEVNSWIDAHANPDFIEPHEQAGDDEWECVLELDGLTVTAKLMDEPGFTPEDSPYWAGAPFYQYKVVLVRTGDRRRKYTTIFGGSIDDYNNGRVRAREAAWGVLRELAEFRNYSAESMATEAWGEEWDELDPALRRRLKAAERAFDKFEREMDANMEVIGQ